MLARLAVREAGAVVLGPARPDGRDHDVVVRSDVGGEHRVQGIAGQVATAATDAGHLVATRGGLGDDDASDSAVAP